MAGTIAALIGAGVVILLVGIYNRLVSIRRLMENAWADVDVYLKRRSELIPNLVSTVKGAADFEASTLESLAEARARSLGAAGATPERSAAESGVTSGLVRVTMLAESYPTLKVSENFLQLQRDLSETEKLIASARQYYNACVRDYNTMVESFPSSLIANMAGMKARDFFEIDAPDERAAPVVGLS